MISCPVCAHANEDLKTVCTSCGSFIQDRVPNIDFFWTVWKLVESPKAAFQKIVIAEHKNYVLFQMLFLGISASFALLWSRHAGNEFDNLIYLILLGMIVGLGIALPLGLVMTYGTHWLLRLLGGKGTLRNTYGVFGWSLMPIMLTVIFVLPIELAAIGLRLFSTNPGPMQVKPVVYVTLLILDGCAALWAVNLAGIGFSVAHKISSWRTRVACLASVLAFSAVLYRIFAALII